MSDRIVILDFGSQYTQLIGRRIRDMHVYCELLPWHTKRDEALDSHTKGIILSGGPQSTIYAEGAPYIQDYIIESGLPILGICYGMQALTYKLGGEVLQSTEHEYGLTELDVPAANPLLHEGKQIVWMSHGDHVTKLPAGFTCLATSPNSPYAAMMDEPNKRFGLQFHPEVHHTQYSEEIFA